MQARRHCGSVWRTAPLSVGVLLLTLWALAWPARAELTLRVGLYENEPKIYRDRDGVPAGLFVELLEAMAEARGWQLHFVPCQWRNCLQRLRAGELDLMPDVAATPARRRSLDFHHTPVIQAWSQVFAPAGSNFPAFDRFEGERIAVLADSVQQAFLESLRREQGARFELVTFDDMQAVLASVQRGQADAAVSNNFYGGRHAHDHGLVETPLTFDQVSLFYAGSPRVTPPEVLAQIDADLQRWKAESDSPYFRAVERALAVPTTEVVPRSVTVALAVAALLSVVLALCLIWLRRRARASAGQLRIASARLTRVLDSAPVVLYSLRGPALTLSWVSPNIERIFGFSPHALLQPELWCERIHPDDRSGVVREMARIRDEHHLVQEYRIRDATGKLRYVRDERQFLPPGDSRREAEVIGTWTDLTNDIEQQEKLRQLAHFDPRTGLPNRALLQDRIERVLQRASAEGGEWALILLNLDRFKGINESLGLAAGDQVLQAVARRLTGLIAGDDTVARVGADEFCLVPERALDERARKRFIEGILDAFERPLWIAGRDILLSASIGVALFPRDGRERGELVTAAELALEAAKRAGGNCVREFEPGLATRTRRRLFLETDLRQALARDELVLHFQPQHRLDDSRLAGVEALVRWNHPQRGMISPGEFIPLAEEIGLIGAIDRWVLEQACRQMARWEAQGVAVAQVAVNLSARELHVDDLVVFIRSVLEDTGLAAERLELEITETMLMEHPERALQVLRELATAGVRIAMDDFGTGYSNLAYLRRLPLHRLKIDQSFVRDIGQSRHNESIIETIIALSRALELELVAEGVETRAQQAFLRRAGCPLGQGYLLGRPVPADRLKRNVMQTQHPVRP